jgi:hypothetical protein
MARIAQHITGIAQNISGIEINCFHESSITDGFIPLPLIPQKKGKKKCCKKYERKGRHCKVCPRTLKRK